MRRSKIHLSENTPNDFLPKLDRDPDPGFFVPAGQTQPIRDTSFNKLGQLSPVSLDILLPVKINALQGVTDSGQKTVISGDCCSFCKVRILTKIKINRYPYWKKVTPRPKLILHSSKHYRQLFTHSDLQHKQAYRQLSALEKVNADKLLRETIRYDLITNPDKLFTDKTQLDQDSKKLRNKAKAKFFSYNVVQSLTQVDSPLNTAYRNSLECADTLVQNGTKITGKYCKQRWCITCNRIRTAELLNGYVPQLQTFQDPQFLTLTVPNIEREYLRPMIKQMQEGWRYIYKQVKRKSRVKMYDYEIRGLKKLECTYNLAEDTYHPHYHFIVESDILAELLTCLWMNYWADLGISLSWKAQMHKPVKSAGGYMEIFKYFTKIITNQKEMDQFGVKRDRSGIYVHPLDQIFQAMYGRRTFEPVGISKVSEEIDDIQSEHFEHLKYENKIWQWFETDWYNDSQPLTHYQPSGQIQTILSKIIL